MKVIIGTGVTLNQRTRILFVVPANEDEAARIFETLKSFNENPEIQIHCLQADTVDVAEAYLLDK